MMNRCRSLFPQFGIFLSAVILLLILGVNVVAAEENGNWRSTYDVIMLWVNFLILVFLFMKFAKNPIKNFLKGQQEETAKEIEGLENQRDEMLEKVKNALDGLEKSHIHLNEIKDRIVSEGEKRKQAIIEDAKHHSQLMVEDAKRKIEAQIHMAKKGFREELIDAAVELAIEKLPGIVNDNDNEKLIEQYLATAEAK